MRLLVVALASTAVVLLVALVGCGATEPADTSSVPSSPTSATEEAGASPVVASGLPQLIDIGSDSCVPCQMMAGELEALAQQFAGSVDVVVLDIYAEENEAIVRHFGVRVIPTQILLDPDGDELARHEGYLSKDDMVKMFKDLGYPLTRSFGSCDDGHEIVDYGA